VLPIANHLLTASGHEPHIGIAQHTVANETRGHATGKGENRNDGVGAGVRKPNVILEIFHVGGNVVLVEVGAGFHGHGAGGHGESGPGYVWCGDGDGGVEKRVE